MTDDNQTAPQLQPTRENIVGCLPLDLSLQKPITISSFENSNNLRQNHNPVIT
jgi:hypothetical protein